MKQLNNAVVLSIVWNILWFLQPLSLVQVFAADEPERISVAELKRLLDKGDAVFLVDVRSGYDYNTGHIPGAISIPEDKIQARHQKFPRDRLTVLY